MDRSRSQCGDRPTDAELPTIASIIPPTPRATVRTSPWIPAGVAALAAVIALVVGLGLASRYRKHAPVLTEESPVVTAVSEPIPAVPASDTNATVEEPAKPAPRAKASASASRTRRTPVTGAATPVTAIAPAPPQEEDHFSVP